MGGFLKEGQNPSPLSAFLGLQDGPEMHTFGIEYGLNCAVCTPGHHQVFVSVTRAKRDQNEMKNDEAATIKWLQFRSGSGQLEFSTWS